MKIHLKKYFIASVFFGIINPIFADSSQISTKKYTSVASVNFSPYADLSINTYWNLKYQGMQPMDLLEISTETGIKSYHLVFINDAGSCNPAWAGQTSYSTASAWGARMINKLRANGINYTISFGGASGTDISSACDEEKLVAAYDEIIKTYQPQGIDFDIENGSADIPKLMSALKQIQSIHENLKISFSLPVLPEGLAASGEVIVKTAQKNGLNYSVNIMAMDYGPSYNLKTMGEYAIEASKNLLTFLENIYPKKQDAELWQMIEVTSMIGVNDVNSEQFTLKDADTLGLFAQQNNLKGLSIWSIMRDNPCSDTWASPICSGNNLQTKPYEFSEHFLQKNLNANNI